MFYFGCILLWKEIDQIENYIIRFIIDNFNKEDLRVCVFIYLKRDIEKMIISMSVDF